MFGLCLVYVWFMFGSCLVYVWFMFGLCLVLSRVETISYMESVLLGDPFLFLSHWPRVSCLARLPSLALCNQVRIKDTNIEQFLYTVHCTGTKNIKEEIYD